MSALGGLWNLDANPRAAQSCGWILAAQSIYGPHDSAQWDGGDVALGRRLFHTLPEDAFDNQPLIGASGCALVADLRLDNRSELARALSLSDDQCRVMADSALLLAAWERWGEQCFDRLVGDYAFAVWDPARRRLVLARDPFGARPLHYHRAARFVAFASMPKGLHALPDVAREPDEERTTEIFALVPEFGPRSFYKGIARVEPGTFVVVGHDSLEIQRHWRASTKPLRLSSSEEYAEAMRAHMDEAVRARLRGSESRVGAHLSGGLDSSAIAATAARLLAPNGGKVVAFTAVPREGFDAPEMRGRFGDEGPLAAATAALYPNMEHVLIRTGGRSPLENMDRNFALFERPIVNICNQVWYDAMNSAAQASGLRVMLSAFHGNLTISYDGMPLLPRLIAEGQPLRWLREARALARRRERSWLSIAATSFSGRIPAPVWDRLRRLVRGRGHDAALYTVINRDTFQARRLEAKARDQGMDLSMRGAAREEDLRSWALRRSDLGNYYKGWLGGWGLDVRDPTADRRLVEFCLSVPMEQYLSDGMTRALARRAFCDRLPQAVLSEPRRGLQTADWYENMTAARDGIGAEIERLEQVPFAVASLDLARMRKLVADWPSGGWQNEDVYSAYRLALLRGISVGHFLRKASGSNA